MVDSHSHNGGFSETTTASFGSTFYVGSVSESAAEAVTFSYDFGMDLSTSFTGEDSFDVAIIGGNVTDTAVDGVMGGDGTGDDLVLDGVSYTFPLGGFMVIAGDGVGVDAVSYTHLRAHETPEQRVCRVLR